MEGLIPFVLNVIKKKRERSQYQCLSNGSHHGSEKLFVDSEWNSADKGPSHHRRTRSEFPPDFFYPGQRMGPSGSLKEDIRSISNFSSLNYHHGQSK
jgi:hypothetical protein